MVSTGVAASKNKVLKIKTKNELHNKLKSYCNDLNGSLRASKTNYYKAYFNETKEKANKIWNGIKQGKYYLNAGCPTVLTFMSFFDLVMIKKMWSWFVHIFLVFWEILGKSWFLFILSTGTGEMSHFIQISWWIHNKMFSFLVLSCIFNGVLLRTQKKPEIFNVFIFLGDGE